MKKLLFHFLIRPNGLTFRVFALFVLFVLHVRAVDDAKFISERMLNVFNVEAKFSRRCWFFISFRNIY